MDVVTLLPPYHIYRDFWRHCRKNRKALLPVAPAQEARGSLPGLEMVSNDGSILLRTHSVWDAWQDSLRPELLLQGQRLEQVQTAFLQSSFS